MRIYLDSCVFRLIKKPESKSVLEIIHNDKLHNIYSYSSAHIQDLTRDKTSKKFDDIKFIEEIVEANCWYFDKEIHFEAIPPTEYYGDDFPEYQEKLADTVGFINGNELLQPIKELSQTFQLPKSNFGLDVPIPPGYPSHLKNLIQQSGTFWDMIVGISDLSNELASNQKSFKELVGFLHNTNLMPQIITHLGIEGYNESGVTDKEKFRTTYAKYLMKDGNATSQLALFQKMYNGLEFFGIVKGKPRKQGMLNMVHDGSHAYYGAFNDIIVSEDEDFRNKTRFLYGILDIQTSVIDYDEYAILLRKQKEQQGYTITNMLDELNNMDDFAGRIILEDHQNEKDVKIIKLSEVYYSYFDNLTIINTQERHWSYFSKSMSNYSKAPMVKEIKYITNRLVGELGKDINDRGLFNSEEMDAEKWCGRVWQFDHAFLGLNYSNNIFLEVYVPA